MKKNLVSVVVIGLALTVILSAPAQASAQAGHEARSEGVR